MATTYSEIFDLAMQNIQDYFLEKMFATSLENYENFMTGFLIKSIPNFSNCLKDLEDRDDTLKTFNTDLNTDEKVILSNLLRVEWLTWRINDIRQFEVHLNDTDFKIYSEANNLKEKRNLLNETREIMSKQISKYNLKNFDFSLI